MKQLVLALLLSALLLVVALPGRSASPPLEIHLTTDDFIYEEAQTVYVGNLARQANGVPPLRWNSQLSQAARWFAWDSVENRPEPYCGHQDTNGEWPIDRAIIFGYLGWAGAENAFCGWVTPQEAIDGWLDSPGHRANLLDPNSREVGLGFYRRESDGRGYVAQAFGTDAVFPPVIIENEALSVSTPDVELYIYDRAAGGGFHELGPAEQMMVSNNPCFADAVWEPYVAQKSWQLTSGSGWRQVYVKTQDALGRTSTVSDTIYLGDTLPLDELSLGQASTRHDSVTLYDLDGNGLEQVQFSLNWIVDDTHDGFAHFWGNGEQVNDVDALGGTAFRMFPGAGESFAWALTTQFVKDTPMVAYVRLKVNDNSASTEVARFSVSGGGTDYGPLSLKGTDFTAANQYQEFLLPFTFHDNPDEIFLIFNFWRSGNADVYVDAVHIFTTPVPLTSPYTLAVPGENYRGQGVWVRYTDGTQFSDIEEGRLYPAGLFATPDSLAFMADPAGQSTPPQMIRVSACAAGEWQVSATAPWLLVEQNGDGVEVRVATTDLAPGLYNAEVVVTVPEQDEVSIPVELLVVDELFSAYQPLALNGD